MCRVIRLDRRTVLRGGLLTGAALAGAGALGVSGCSTGPTEEQLTAERLVPLARAALADERNARALAATEPAYAGALAIVADQRADHARALREEITRLDRDVASTIDDTGEAGTSGSPAPPAPPSLVALRSSLEQSAGEARDVAISLTGYPAGLVGSVAASVRSMREVQLA